MINRNTIVDYHHDDCQNEPGWVGGHWYTLYASTPRCYGLFTVYHIFSDDEIGSPNFHDHGSRQCKREN